MRLRSKTGRTGQAGNRTAHARSVSGVEIVWLKDGWGSPHGAALYRDLGPILFRI